MSGRPLHLVLLDGARAAVAAGQQDLIRQVSSQAFVAHHRRWHHLLTTAVDAGNGEFASITVLDRVSVERLNAITVASYSSESATRGRVKGQS